MRISTDLVHQRGVNAIFDQQSQLSKTQLQLASGLKLLTPSDDPAAAARVLDLNRSREVAQQHQDNIETVRTRLKFEESTLANAGNLLHRVKELAIQGVNATQNPANRAVIGGEARQLLDEMLSLANTKNLNDEYLFGGFKSKTQAFSGDASSGGFAYNGDDNQRLVEIGPNRQVSDGDPGEKVFGEVGVDSVFDALYRFAGSMETNSPDPTSIDEISASLERIVEARSSTGHRLRALDEQQNTNADYSIAVESTLAEIQALDYAEAASRLSQQSFALQAAQQSFARIQGLSLFNYL